MHKSKYRSKVRGAGDCYRKTQYGSEERAEIVAKHILKTGGPKLRAYGCPKCGAFHLTSML